MELKIPRGHFSGKPLKSSSLAGLVLAESLYLPDTRLARHSHESACFCFVLSGAFDEVYGRKERICKSGTLLFRPSDESHLDHFLGTETRCFNIEIDAKLLGQLRDLSKINNESIEFGDPGAAATARKLYEEFRWMDDVSGLAIEGLSLELLASLSREISRDTGNRPPRWLESVRALIREEFSENLSIAALSQTAGVHPVHLSRTFRKYFRSTVAGYVRQVRIETACGLLSGSSLPLAQVALSAGFSHQSHFSNAFKKNTGLTPAQYRFRFRPH